VVTEPPVVGFGARETRTVDAGLLASAQADDGAMQRVSDAVGLGVFQGKCRDYEVSQGSRRNLKDSPVRERCVTSGRR
jgi:hypothetical protein